MHAFSLIPYFCKMKGKPNDKKIKEGTIEGQMLRVQKGGRIAKF